MDRRSAVAVLVIALLVGVPFLGKAFHIDDTFVLRISQQILDEPVRPFHFTINWRRNPSPCIEITKNPPLVSYYLAPFVALFGYSEPVLHGAMMLFVVLLGAACVLLGRRFGVGPMWPLLFVLLSPAIVVSGNVMRDVPAAGLGTLGVALFILGVDRDRRAHLAWGAALVGLATLAKYSSATLIVVMALYAALRRKWRHAEWLVRPIAMLGLWSRWNWLSLGRTHIGVLLAQRAAKEAGFTRPMLEKLLSGLTIPSAMLYFLPAVLVALALRRRWLVVAAMVALGIVTVLGARAYQASAPVILRRKGQPTLKGRIVAQTTAKLTVMTHAGTVDVPKETVRKRIPPLPSVQYYFWVAAGALLLATVLLGGLVAKRPPKLDFTGLRSDGPFLALWVAGVFAFSVIFTPFQAVRHFLPALVPTAILSLRLLGSQGRAVRAVLMACLALQAGVAYLVGAADAEHAASYRRFVRYAKEKYQDAGEEVWFNGHWGFHHYAAAAGFRGMNRDVAPFPPEGAIVLHPRPVAQAGWPKGLKRKVVEAFPYERHVAARTMDGRHASFYSLTHQRSPYFFPSLSSGERDVPLLTCSVYRVVEAPPNAAHSAEKKR